MIEVAKLEKVYAAETAADGWWDGLSDKEKKAYVKAHPWSKYAKGASRSRKSPTGNSHGSKADVAPIHSVLRTAGLTRTQKYGLLAISSITTTSSPTTRGRQLRLSKRLNPQAGSIAARRILTPTTQVTNCVI